MITEIRCSQLHRPMNCIGFLLFENIEEMEAGDAAKEGTACGELLSEMIRQKSFTPQVGSHASNNVFFDNDMWYHCSNIYNDILQTAQGAHISTEERIDWKTQAGITIRGQFDIEYVTPGVLHIEDLKYGWGIVDVKRNWQLIGYAIGRVNHYMQVYGWQPNEIHFTIHQPRPYHPDGRTRTWVITIQELYALKQEIEAMAMRYVQGDRTLSTGKQCKYCPAMNSCPAANAALWNAVDVTMTEWSQDTLSNNEIGMQLKQLQRVQEILKIKQSSLEQLAIMRSQNGQPIPGWSYEMEYGDRKWKPGVTVETIKILTGKDITKTEMMSPNQAEKAGLNRRFIAELCEKSSKGLKLVEKNIVEEAIKILPKPY